MTENIRKEIRLSETVSPFGPGAIADISGLSLVAPDLSEWSSKWCEEITCPRLSEQLGGGRLLSAPVVLGDLTDKAPTIPFWRFPAWRFCERCGAITKRTAVDRGRYKNACPCKAQLVPMRFIAVCESGSHMQDIDWPTWVHRASDDPQDSKTEEQRHCRQRDSLKLRRVSAAGEGLASMLVICIACDARRSMAALGSKTALHDDGYRCFGSQPWLRKNDSSECSSMLIPKQRGATGNYIADIVSAIEIPPSDDPEVELLERIAAHPGISFVRDMLGSPMEEALIGSLVSQLAAEGLVAAPAQVMKAARASGQVAERPIVALKEGEWFAFQSKLEAGLDPEESQFIVDGRTRSEGVTAHPQVGALIDGVGQVRRLREVRALQGYRRHSPDAQKQPADIGGYARVPSFPALEMFGEGVFLRFDREVLSAWELQEDVQQRCGTLRNRLASSPLKDRLDDPSPRYLALHTFAHLLLRRLSFASGYSSASLQERVYAGSTEGVDMCGVLIYTAAGDAQGTLGGLVRLGDPGRLEAVILGALNDGWTCSNDPVCMESDSQGATRLNLAACHGCCLVSETSCEARNSLLDRQLLFGGANIRNGLFSPLIEALHG